MARPSGAAWQPLGLSSDPVPGDPVRVQDEATELGATARLLQDQVAALRRIATSNENIGKTPDKIRSAAQELAGNLVVVATRYQKVSTALQGWYPELDGAQRMSLQALNEAEGPYASLQNIPKPNVPGMTQAGDGQWTLDPMVPVTPKQQTQFDDYQRAMGQAQQQLSNAQQLLQKATSHRDTEASYYAGLINSASNDSLVDSWWDSFSNWVSENAGILKEIANVLGYIAIGLAILCLFIPGVDLIILAAMAVTAMMLVIHTMLASTGNGSWLDVALDVVGLLTLGMGLGAADGVEALESGANEAATQAWRQEAVNVLEDYKPALSFFRSLTDSDGALTDLGRAGVKAVGQLMKDELPRLPAGAEEASGFWAKTAAQLSANWNTWGSAEKIGAVFTHAGDPAIADATDSLAALAKDYPAVSQVTDALGSASRTVRWANVAFYGGNVATLGDFGVHLRFGDAYDKWKDDHFSYPLSTTEANIPGDFAFQGFRLASSFMGN